MKNSTIKNTNNAGTVRISGKYISVISSSLLFVGIALLSFFAFHHATHPYFMDMGWKYVLIGAFAELANGTIGMAYGITTASALLSMGNTPLITGSVVHVSEIFTGGANGLFHFRFKNVNHLMFRKLLYPSIAGAGFGALLLFLFSRSHLLIKRIIYVYILSLGILILYKAMQPNIRRKKIKFIGMIVFVAGVLDSLGCGGYGTTASTSLIAGGRGALPTIGAVSGVKFFVALTSSVTLLLLSRTTDWMMIAMLVSGGVIAAPVGPYLAKRLPKKALMFCLGLAVIFVSLKQLFF